MGKRVIHNPKKSAIFDFYEPSPPAPLPPVEYSPAGGVEKFPMQLVEHADKLFMCTKRGLNERQQVFITAFLQWGTKLRACQAAGVDPREVTEWAKKNKAFQSIYDEAVLMVCGVLEEEALRRALQGSDKLLLSMLKALDPGKYSEKSVSRLEGRVEHALSWSELARKTLEEGRIIDVEAVEAGGENF